MAISKLTELIMRHEGTGPIRQGRMMPYRDTVGKLTLGWGRNLDDRGLARTEAILLLENDIRDARDDLIRAWPWITKLDAVRFDVMVSMAFNMGMPRLAAFIRLRHALQRDDWTAAAAEMLDSKWASQVGDRAWELAGMMIEGRYL